MQWLMVIGIALVTLIAVPFIKVGPQGPQGPAGPAGGATIYQDESVDLTSKPRLAFTGAGVTCTTEASRNKCDVPGGGGAGFTTGAAGHIAYYNTTTSIASLAACSYGIYFNCTTVGSSSGFLAGTSNVTSGSLSLFHAGDAHSTTIVSPSTTSVDQGFVWPSTLGTSGQCLKSDGANPATLSFGACGGLGLTGSGTVNHIPYFDSSSTVANTDCTTDTHSIACPDLQAGNSSHTGTFTIMASGGNATIFTRGTTGSTNTLKVPSTNGTNGQCIKTDGGAPAQLSFGNCGGSTLDGAAITDSAGAQTTLNDGTETKINFDTTEFDDNSMADLTNDKITIATTGRYMVSMQLWFNTSGNAGLLMTLLLRKNGANFNGQLAAQAACNTAVVDCINSTDGVILNASGIFQLTAADYLQVYGLVTNAGNTNTGSGYGFLRVQQIK